MVLAAAAWILQSTLSAIATRAAVSDSAVTRFSRSLGLDGFQAFGLKLAQSLVSGAAMPNREVVVDDSAADLAVKVFERAACTLRDVAGQLLVPP